MALIKCPECGKEVSDQSETCVHCGYPLKKEYPLCPYCGNEVKNPHKYCYKCGRYIEKQVGMDEIIGGTTVHIYCPKCHSDDCSPHQERYDIPEQTKTSYSANLNPFKPFTFVNKKEKVVKKAQTIVKNKHICNKCGNIF